MASYILYWNAKDWEWDTLQQNREAALVSGSHSIIWSVGYASPMVEGDRVFILRLGTPPNGIVASGFVTGSLIAQPGSNDTKAIALELDVILDARSEPILTRNKLDRGLFKDTNWIRPGRAYEIPPSVAARLEAQWSRLVARPTPERPRVTKSKNYYSCFISYTSADEHFAHRLRSDLQMNGVLVWFASEDIKTGEFIQKSIDDAVHFYDKLVVILSQNSINRAWVRYEYRKAVEKEEREKRQVVFPIRLDDAVFNTTEQWAFEVRQRHIGDFTESNNPLLYQNSINRLLRDLNKTQLAREKSSLAKQPAGNISIASRTSIKGRQDAISRAQNPRLLQLASRPEQIPPFPVFVHIPAGEFLLGISDAEVKRVWRLKATRMTAGELEDRGFFNREQPRHTVMLADYSIEKNLVTNAEYRFFLEATGHPSPRGWSGTEFPRGSSSHPVTNVSWEDATTYCEWLTEIHHNYGGLGENEIIRLPTEAEWEKAASWNAAKKTKNMWAWGNTWDMSKCNTRESSASTITQVGKFSPAGDSTYGVSDITGNVYEWCNSLFRPYPYNISDGRENWQGGGQRVARGGSYAAPAAYSRTTVRLQVDSSSKFVDFGFRCVKSLDIQTQSQE